VSLHRLQSGIAAFTGDAGREFAGEQAFPEPRISDEKRDVADRDTAGPKPLDRFALDARRRNRVGPFGRFGVRGHVGVWVGGMKTVSPFLRRVLTAWSTAT
jgi:hypothetical protein